MSDERKAGFHESTAKWEGVPLPGEIPKCARCGEAIATYAARRDDGSIVFGPLCGCSAERHSEEP